MTKKYNVICMSFDGEYKTEQFESPTIQEAWNRANDLGSKWHFYPFYFVVSESGKTVIDAPDFPLDFLKGKKVKTVQAFFERVSKLEEAKNADCEKFSFLLLDNS